MIILLAILLAVTVFLVKGILDDSQSSDTNQIAENNYDYSKFKLDENGFMSYSDKNGLKGTTGIDVSSHNGYIDWAKVAKSGIKFAYIRVGYRGYTEGEIKDDPYFSYNIQNARANGIDVGVYFFSQAINGEEAVEEADYVADKISGYNVKYPVAFDMEYNNVENERIGKLTQKQKTEIMRSFCFECYGNGYKPIVYGNNQWLAGEFDISSVLNFDTWYAGYSNKPMVKYSFEIWQYSNSGVIDGIDGTVDMNICLKEY